MTDNTTETSTGTVPIAYDIGDRVDLWPEQAEQAQVVDALKQQIDGRYKEIERLRLETDTLIESWRTAASAFWADLRQAKPELEKFKMMAVPHRGIVILTESREVPQEEKGAVAV